MSSSRSCPLLSFLRMLLLLCCFYSVNMCFRVAGGREARKMQLEVCLGDFEQDGIMLSCSCHCRYFS